MTELPDVFHLVSHRDFGLDPILRVHSPDFVEYLQTIYQEWVAAGRTPQGVLPDSFPHPALVNHLPENRWKASTNSSIEAKVSTYAFDLGTMIVDGKSYRKGHEVYNTSPTPVDHRNI